MADLDLVRRLVEADHGLAVICTTRSDNTIQTSLVNAGVMTNPLDGNDAVAFVARGGTVKLKRLRQRSYANIVLRAGWEWASVEGATVIIGPDDSQPGFDSTDLPALLRAVFQSAGGTHDDWDAFDRTMADERRAAVFINADRISSNA